MPRKFSELRSKMSPESQARAKARTDEMLREMRLAELRRARELTQQQLASELKVNQAWISKVERQTDMYLSTLRAYIEAVGGELDIIARFGDESVRISRLDELVRPEESVPAEVTARSVEAQFSGREQIRVAIYPSLSDPISRAVDVWRSGASSTTGQSRTPTANTDLPTSKAA